MQRKGGAPNRRALRRALLDAAHPNPAERSTAPPIAADLIPGLLHAAGAHGILPLCAARLRAAGLRMEPGVERSLLVDAALALALTAEGDRLLSDLRGLGLEVRLVKGAAFARALYPGEIRGFTDIDLLLRHEDFAAAGTVLAKRSYRQVPFRLKHATGYAEEKWQRAPDDPLGPLLVELHWDMIGSPTLRRGRRCDLALLRTATPAQEQAQHLLVAAVHGALGDGFTRLQPLADLARALRAGPDVAWLAERVEAGRLAKPLALALDLAHRCFALPEASRVLREARLARPPWWVRALLPVSLVAAPRPQDSASGGRRQAVREWLKCK